MSQSQAHIDGETSKFVNFIVCDQAFCIRLDRIQEIRGWSKVTPLPHAPDGVLGVINLRGAVIPIYDLALSLGIGVAEQNARSVVVVARVRGSDIGLLVDSVADIVTIEDDEIKPPPEIANGSNDFAIEGLIGEGDGFSRIINLDLVIESQDKMAS